MVKLDPQTEMPVFLRMQAEIIRDMDEGLVPRDCSSFSELHDYVDANEYGGACETDPDCPQEITEEQIAFWNRLQAAIDNWLQCGGPDADFRGRA